MPIGSPGNTWHRLLPVSRSDTWETVKLSIDDLPGAIANAVTLIQLRCISDDPPFIANIDDLTAVLPEMIADSSRAVVSRLGGIVVGGAAVPCSVRSPSEPVPIAPALDVLNLDVQFAPSRVRDARIARDYTDGGGLRLVPVGDPYDLTYSITPISNTGDQNAGMIEAVLRRIAYFDVLDVDGDRQTIETLWIDRLERPPLGDESPVLFYKVGARQTASLSQSVREVDEVRLVTDQG